MSYFEANQSLPRFYHIFYFRQGPFQKNLILGTPYLILGIFAFFCGPFAGFAVPDQFRFALVVKEHKAVFVGKRFVRFNKFHSQHPLGLNNTLLLRATDLNQRRGQPLL